MSSRYSICASASQIAKRFSVEVSPAYQPYYNASPTRLLPLITNTGPKGLSFFYWGLAPEWAKNKPITERAIQVRAEWIPEKPMYRKMLSQRRCLIPADGFYEWKKLGKKTQVPYRYTLQSKELFCFAGLWEEYDDENQESFHTFTMLTCPANSLVALSDERMPVILDRESETSWLNMETPIEELTQLLTPYPSDQMDFYPVSPRIGSTEANDASLILATPPSDQHGNLTLFD